MKDRAERGIRRRRVLLVLAALAVAWLVVDKAVSVVASDPGVGHWRSRDGFEDYRSAYEEVMATLPEPTRAHDVTTEYGTVRVYEWTASDQGERDEDAHGEGGAGEEGAAGEGAGGEEDGDRLPVVLLPGISSGAPMWGENLTHWIGHRTLYAMDAVGDAGMSTQSVPFTSFDDQAAWVEQMLAGLDVERAHMVGHSFGGAIAATHALAHPGRVASLTLLEPVMVLQGLPASTYLWSSLLVLPVPQSWKDRGLAEIGGTTVEEVRERTPMSVMIDEGSEHYAAVMPVPRTLTDQEWESLEMPVRVDIADDKSLAGGEEAAQRARDLGKEPVTVWPRTTHSLPMQAAEELGSELERYWSEHDR
ncbi:alpha/beta hydrolase [Nocardiopsis ganjiahuensis]|uniref:alpha/beta hydrolase n=1 Tax=Nocardiopsis ganjiahuensis TaxID=239984 RepID=UPI000477A85E|nr:alpha/beta hydrolase [Nocardiopsis ganjiahuensis]